MRVSRQLRDATLAKGQLTTSQAAAIALCGAETVRRWCRAGKVAHEFKRGMYFVDGTSLHKWIGDLQQQEAQ
jgi:hypothetical protein